MNDLTRAAIEEDIIRSREKMAIKRAKIEEKSRDHLSTKKWRIAINFLMRVGVATDEDWGVLKENIGQARASKLASDMGYPLDYKYENHKDYR